MPFSVAAAPSASSLGVWFLRLTGFYIPPLKMLSQDSALPVDPVFHGA